MQNRRDFIKNTGALALGGLLFNHEAEAFFGHKPHPLGVQLYSTMSIIDKDLTGTLKQIAAIGYTEIESAFSMKGGYYGLKPKEFASLVKDLGMSWQAHHVMGTPFKMPTPPKSLDTTKNTPAPPPRLNLSAMKSLLNDTNQIVEEAAEGGVNYLVCASIALKTTEETKSSIEILHKAAEACKKVGLNFVYHNHTIEFEKLDNGQTPFEMISSQISADLLKFELDLAWATKAGVDIPALFQQHKGRFPLFHVKDLNRENKPVEIGAGYIDFKNIFAHAKTAGVKHFFVEQDGAPKPIENLKTSFGNLTKIL